MASLEIGVQDLEILLNRLTWERNPRIDAQVRAPERLRAGSELTSSTFAGTVQGPLRLPNLRARPNQATDCIRLGRASGHSMLQPWIF